jgi:hypothetical protein
MFDCLTPEEQGGISNGPPARSRELQQRPGTGLKARKGGNVQNGIMLLLGYFVSAVWPALRVSHDAFVVLVAFCGKEPSVKRSVNSRVHLCGLVFTLTRPGGHPLPSDGRGDQNAQRWFCPAACAVRATAGHADRCRCMSPAPAGIAGLGVRSPRFVDVDRRIRGLKLVTSQCHARQRVGHLVHIRPEIVRGHGGDTC